MTALINPYWFAGDPYFANVVLLLHCDGAHLSTTIIDSSSIHRTCTANAGVLTNVQFKFGTTSWNSGGATSISCADSADWLFGSGQFTVEAWVRLTSAPTVFHAVAAQFGGSTNLGWFFGFNGNTLNFYYSTTGANTPVVTGAYAPALNTWIHVAADRDAGNVLRVYADGVVIASAAAAVTFFDSTRPLRIGNDDGGSRSIIGYIDEVRITKGVARYAGAFATPTAAFPDA